MNLDWKAVYLEAVKENPDLFKELKACIEKYVRPRNDVTSNDAGREILGSPWSAKTDWEKMLKRFGSSLFGQAMYETLKNEWSIEDRTDRKGKKYRRKKPMPSGH